MRFKRNTLCNILAIHQTNLDKKAIDPIFASVLIQYNKNNITITSTDTQRYLKSSIEYTMDNTSEESKSFLINGSLLYDIIKKSKSEYFKITEENNQYLITIDNAQFKISQNLNEDSYKNNLQWDDSTINELIIPANILNESLKLIKWATSNENARLALTGICFDLNNNELTLCATDTLKLAVIKINCDSNIQGKWILGKKSISDLIHILDECGQENISISFDKHFSVHYQTTEQQTTWKSLFLLGDYPPYQKVLQIQNQMNTNFEIDSSEFNKIIDRIMIASNQNYPIISFNFNKDQSTISSENTILSGIDNLPIQYSDINIKIAFNGRFIQEMMSNLSGIVKFSIKDPLSPIMVQPLINMNLIFIMAPVHMNN